MVVLLSWVNWYLLIVTNLLHFRIAIRILLLLRKKSWSCACVIITETFYLAFWHQNNVVLLLLYPMMRRLLVSTIHWHLTRCLLFLTCPRNIPKLNRPPLVPDITTREVSLQRSTANDSSISLSTFLKTSSKSTAQEHEKTAQACVGAVNESSYLWQRWNLRSSAHLYRSHNLRLVRWSNLYHRKFYSDVLLLCQIWTRKEFSFKSWLSNAFIFYMYLIDLLKRGPTSQSTSVLYRGEGSGFWRWVRSVKSVLTQETCPKKWNARTNFVRVCDRWRNQP